MPTLATRHFGDLQYEPDAIFEFDGGIPGFEAHDRFLFIEQPHADPLVFMQSLGDPELCFIAVPVFVADPHYGLEMTPEDRAALQLHPDTPVEIGRDVVCLGLVTVTEGADPTVNLASPVVLNLRSRKGVQSVRGDGRYSLRQPLPAGDGAPVC
jgi:flagellar assembly factor FliW